MTVHRTLPLAQEWKERLGLSERRAPEYYESSEAAIDTPHAVAIRTALRDIGLSGVFCIQGVPTVGILTVEQYDPTTIVDLHGALWNQGLASLLLVISGDTLRAFSLARKPQKEWGHEFDERCLIETLNATAHALEIQNLLHATESGRLWKEHSDFFRPKERIDQVLLDNLNASHRSLCADLSSDAAQALLIQAMFIAYLEDREIITPTYFKASSNDKVDSFISLLEKRDVRLLKSLFATLRDDFNGDLFVAPCSFEPQKKLPSLTVEHLAILASFRSGREEMMKGGQFRFWGYDFRYIPIELVSAVYDRFLGEKEEERKAQGAYYTPMFLADTVVSQFWDVLPSDTKERGRFLDPACGSGVFLVRSFQRLCEHWRATHPSKTIRWDSLLAILRRIHGWDINGAAVRVAIFSLYVALLEEVDPPDIRALIKSKRVLPELWNKTLLQNDFFEVAEAEHSFDVIVGNPPWTSRRGPERASIQWCKKQALPMPNKEDAWAFVWKSLKHLRRDGVTAFLLPAMGFLHNHADVSLAARKLLLQRSRVTRVINFADLRFQLFDGAIRPAALILFGINHEPGTPYRLEYWTPKADLNLQIKRTITLSSADKFSLSSMIAQSDPLAFKHRLWMSDPETKLFSYLANLPKLEGFIKEYKYFSRRHLDVSGHWVVGMGYQPHNEPATGESASKYSISRFVGSLPDLPIEQFSPIAQTTVSLKAARSKRVRRKGFEAAFTGVRILVPRTTSQGRLRAAYTENDLTFQDIIQGISVPKGERAKAKLVTALLNSKVAAWYAFHGTASFGSERPEVKASELLHLPFPAAENLPEPSRARAAAEKLVALIDSEIEKTNGEFELSDGEHDSFSQIDRWSYEYFCLSNHEIILIEDTLENIVPAIQPSQGSYPDLWKPPTEMDRREYATTLIRGVEEWLQRGTSLHASLEAKSADLGVLRIAIGPNGTASNYNETNLGINEALSRIAHSIHQPLSGNFQLMPDLRIFVGRSLYLVKPMQRRFWLRSAALSDAGSIAADLQTSVDIESRRGIA